MSTLRNLVLLVALVGLCAVDGACPITWYMVLSAHTRITEVVLDYPSVLFDISA